MSRLLIVNIEQSSRTESFWKTYKDFIFSRLPDCDLYFPKKSEDFPDFKEYKTLILIGDDTFFSSIINRIFPYISKLKNPPPFAIIPDSDSSALANGLAIPNQLSPNIEIIRSQTVIPLDLVRCNFKNLQSQPETMLALNGILVGLPLIERFQTRKILANWVKQRLFHPQYYKKRHIMIFDEHKEVFEGSYVFGMMLLGNQITNGPKLRKQLRINLKAFDYFQLNSWKGTGIRQVFSSLFQENLNQTGILFHKKSTFMELTATGPDSYLMIDGKMVGKLPAQLTFLPKAIQIISPITTIKKVAWKTKVLNSNSGLSGQPG